MTEQVTKQKDVNDVQKTDLPVFQYPAEKMCADEEGCIPCCCCWILDKFCYEHTKSESSNVTARIMMKVNDNEHESCCVFMMMSICCCIPCSCFMCPKLQSRHALYCCFLYTIVC
jgi:hypothetical protein